MYDLCSVNLLQVQATTFTVGLTAVWWHTSTVPRIDGVALCRHNMLTALRTLCYTITCTCFILLQGTFRHVQCYALWSTCTCTCCIIQSPHMYSTYTCACALVCECTCASAPVQIREYIHTVCACTLCTVHVQYVNVYCMACVTSWRANR